MRPRAGLLVLGLIMLLGGCGVAAHARSRPAGRAIQAPRAKAVSAGQAAQLRDGDARFAGRALALLAREQPTVALSPYSISEALAMIYAGARGATATQMASALDFTLPPARLAAAFGATNRELAGDVTGPAELRLANALYGQSGEQFRSPFLRLLGSDYGAPLRTVDFVDDTAAALAAINHWVRTETLNKIPQLLGPGDVDSSTRLVAVSAVYLHASWLSPFAPADTHPAPFESPGGRVNVATMHQTAPFAYTRASGYQALELPYAGGRLAFDVVLPDRGAMDALLTRIARDGPLSLLRGLRSRGVALALPKFRLTTRVELATPLGELGMPLAFEPGAADLSGIAGQPGSLYIKAAVHQAYLRVDESGTTAAAATGVTVSSTAVILPQVRFDVDRPFVFVLRDVRTGAVLFCGVVSRP